MRTLAVFVSLALLPTMIQDPDAAPAPSTCHRIVSLAPSATEILFALGLGDSVVGVTRFCRHPREAALQEKVGGYVDTNYESIAILKPDLVVVLSEQTDQERRLGDLGIRALRVDHRRVDGILGSLTTIGAACGKTQEAEDIVAGLRRRMEDVKKRVGDAERPTVLLTLGPNIGGEVPHDGLRTFARGGLYDELLTLAGGRNAYEGRTPEYPILSAEGILSLNPQFIVELVPDFARMGWRKEDLLERWKRLQSVEAVKNGRITIVSEDYATVPGPRFVLLLEELARTLHPTLDWN